MRKTDQAGPKKQPPKNTEGIKAGILVANTEEAPKNKGKNIRAGSGKKDTVEIFPKDRKKAAREKGARRTLETGEKNRDEDFEGAGQERENRIMCLVAVRGGASES